MENLIIHFFHSFDNQIRDIWCANAQVSVEKNLSRLHSWTPAKVYLCQKNFFIHSKQKKKELLVIFLIYLVLSDDLGKKKKKVLFSQFSSF